MEVSYLVQAGGLIQTRVGHTLVDVQFAARSHITPLTFALEGALRVDALPCVLTWVGSCLKQNIVDFIQQVDVSCIVEKT